MNNFHNCLEINNINSQIEKAEIQKRRIIINIYREYESYLNLVRDLLCVSIEKGITELCTDPSMKNFFLNSNGLFDFFEKKISKLIYSKLPFITLEQLIINKNEENITQEVNFNSLRRSLKIRDHQIEEFQYQDSENLLNLLKL